MNPAAIRCHVAACFVAFGMGMIRALGAQSATAERAAQTANASAVQAQSEIETREANTNLVPRVILNRAWTNVTVAAGVDATGAPRMLTRRVPQIEFVGHEARASAGAIKLSVARNLNTRGAVQMRLPDGKVLTSHVLGLGYYDAASGRSVLLAEITNCTATLEAPDRLVFRNAFDGLLADVRYVYGRASVEQDVLLRETPPSPAEFGLNPETTRLEVLTEFLSPPAPVKSARPLNLRRLEGETAAEVSRASAATAPAIVKRTRDERLKFGGAHIIEGKAFESPRSAGLQTGVAVSAPATNGGTNRTAQTAARLTVPVAKTWEKMEGRDFLIEAVDYRSVRPTLEKLSRRTAALTPGGPGSLPDIQSAAAPARGRVTAGRALPAVPPEASAQKRTELAGRSPLPSSDGEKGAPMLVLDYVIAASWQDFVWCDDAMPTDSTDDAITWTWISESPAPYSGSLAHYSDLDENGMSHHYFHGAPQTVLIQPGDILYAWVWLDPESTPGEIMLQWEEGDVWPIGHWDPAEWYEDPPESENWVQGTWVDDGYGWSSSWAHMAYWGADLIGWGSGTNDAHRPMGDLPATGQWVKLEVPAKLVGLEGKTIHGLAFTAQGGVAVWDRAGKINGDATWLDDAVPAGGEAAGYSDSNWTNYWRWTNANPAPFHGTQAVQQAPAALAQNWFQFATNTLLIGAEQTLFAWVYLSPTNPPTEIMIQWGITYTNWESELATDWRRTYWGADDVIYGTVDTDDQRWMGPIPASNQWVRLEIPSDALGLEGQEIANLSFDVYGGKATWDYVGVSSSYNPDMDGDGLPDAWERQYFGSHARHGANDDPDGDGLTNLQEFQLGTNPMVADSDGDGVNDGDEVADGTNPLDSNSHRADVTPPTLVITSPTNWTTSKPYLQLFGFANEPLREIVYDLNNASGVSSNRQIFVTGHDLDTNTIRETTNYFRGYDIPLAEGENDITVRARDVAGNRATQSFTLMFSTNTDTQPPVVRWQWPTNGAVLAGAEFTLRGELDDETAKVRVTLSDATEVAGIVERNGVFWIEHLPLTNGVNLLTLSATDFAGNVSNVTFTVYSTNVSLVLGDPVGWFAGARVVSVTGLVSSGYAVWVNGVRATNENDGAWTAERVPISNDGTVTFAATAIPLADHDGDGTAPGAAGSALSAMHNPAAMNPAGTNAVSASADPAQAAAVQLEKAIGSALVTPTNNQVASIASSWVFYNDRQDGFFKWGTVPPANYNLTGHEYFELWMSNALVWLENWIVAYSNSQPTRTLDTNYPGDSPGELWAVGDLTDTDTNVSHALQRHSDSEAVVRVGGKGGVASAVLLRLQLETYACSNLTKPAVVPDVEVYESISANSLLYPPGMPLCLNAEGVGWVIVAANSTLTVSPKRVNGGYIAYDASAAVYPVGLKSVEFTGAAETIYQDINDQTAYPVPHWEATNSSPVLFPAGSTMTAKVKLETEATGIYVTVVGKGGGYTFTGNGPIDGTIHVTATTSLPTNLVQYFEQFTIAWEIVGVAGNSNTLSIPLGESKNELYVSHKAPANLTEKLFHTVAHLACEPAKGESVESNIVVKIWTKFGNGLGTNGTPANTHRRNPDAPMKYWGADAFATRTNGSAFVRTSELLLQADGKCGAWASLFYDTISAHSIPAQITAITTPTALVPPQVPGSWTLVETDLLILPNAGQNNNTPGVRFFLDHGVVKCANHFPATVFDPSYGRRYESNAMNAAESLWEDGSIELFVGKWQSGFLMTTPTKTNAVGVKEANFSP